MQYLNIACVLFIEAHGLGPSATRVTSLVAQQVRTKVIRKAAGGTISQQYTLKLTPAELEAVKVMRIQMNLSVDIDNALFRLIHMNEK